MEKIVAPDLTILTTEENESTTVDDVRLGSGLMLVSSYLRRKQFRKLISTYEENRKLSGTTLVVAHGSYNHGKWCFAVNCTHIRVQDGLVDRLDGTCGLIILNICNPHSETICSSQSIVVHPTSSVSLRQLLQGKGRPRMFVPGFGYVEDKIPQVLKALQSASS